MTTLEWLELLSYVVTVIGLPMAILMYMREQRKERQTDDEELYLTLSDDYAKFLRLVLENADLHLMTDATARMKFTDEQLERRKILFEILIAIFERAYILVYEERMSRQAARLWQTWEDYMHEWCRRQDFRALLPHLLEGEDREFQQYISQIAVLETRNATQPSEVAPFPTEEPDPDSLRRAG